MTKFVGVLTSGGDNPGLNAAIRGLGKAALGCYNMQVIGFRDGFRGLMENRSITLDGKNAFRYSYPGRYHFGGPVAISRTK